MSDNHDIIAQSRNSVLMSYNYGNYELRIMLHIARNAHAAAMKGSRYNDHLKEAYCTDGINLNMAIPIKQIIGKTHNYAPLKEKLLDMQSKWIVQYYDSIKKVWRASSVIYNIALEERTGIMRFSVAKWLVDYICDFRQGGYCEYDFENALSLRNPFAARLYLLMCSQKSKYNIKIEALKKLLGIGERYARTNDFIRRCIEPARAELEEKGFNGFTYELSRSKDKITKGADMITFAPIRREQRCKITIAQIRKDVLSIPQQINEVLMIRLKLSSREIYNNKDMISAFAKNEGCINKLYEILQRAITKGVKNKKRYVLGAMKRSLTEG